MGQKAEGSSCRSPNRRGSGRFGLTPPDSAAGDRFGSAVALVGSSALVGAYLNDGNRPDEGSAYLFQRAGSNIWAEQREFRATNGGDRDYFGRAVALASGEVLVGDPKDDEAFNAQGSAYFFDFELAQCSLCSNDADCGTGRYCDSSGVCLAQKARGRACEDADCRAPGCAVCTTGCAFRPARMLSSARAAYSKPLPSDAAPPPGIHWPLSPGPPTRFCQA